MKTLSLTDKVIKFWDTRPCNIRHSNKKIGTYDYHTEVMRRRYFVESHIINWIRETPGFYRRKLSVLEIGSGIGSDAFFWAFGGHAVLGIDFSKKSVGIAKKGLKALKFDGQIKFKAINAEELSKHLPVKTYDVIYIYGVLHHTPNQDKLLEEIKKYMDKNTILKLMVYNKWSWKGFNLWLKDRSWKNTEAQQNCPISRVHSKAEIKKLLKDFDILEMKVDFIFPYKVEKYIKHEYEKVWYWPLLAPLQKLIGWHILVTAKKNV